MADNNKQVSKETTNIFDVIRSALHLEDGEIRALKAFQSVIVETPVTHDEPLSTNPQPGLTTTVKVRWMREVSFLGIPSLSMTFTRTARATVSEYEEADQISSGTSYECSILVGSEFFSTLAAFQGNNSLREEFVAAVITAKHFIKTFDPKKGCSPDRCVQKLLFGTMRLAAELSACLADPSREFNPPKALWNTVRKSAQSGQLGYYQRTLERIKREGIDKAQAAEDKKPSPRTMRSIVDVSVNGPAPREDEEVPLNPPAKLRPEAVVERTVLKAAQADDEIGKLRREVDELKASSVRTEKKVGFLWNIFSMVPGVEELVESMNRAVEEDLNRGRVEVLEEKRNE